MSTTEKAHSVCISWYSEHDSSVAPCKEFMVDPNPGLAKYRSRGHKQILASTREEIMAVEGMPKFCVKTALKMLGLESLNE